MTRDEVRARALEIVGNHTAAGHQAGWTLGGRNMDSLDIIEMTMSFEDEWEISISDELWHHDTPVEQVVLDVQRMVCSDLS